MLLGSSVLYCKRLKISVEYRPMPPHRCQRLSTIIPFEFSVCTMNWLSYVWRGILGEGMDISMYRLYYLVKIKASSSSLLLYMQDRFSRNLSDVMVLFFEGMVRVEKCGDIEERN